MNKLNFMIRELNGIFSTDYNCASFSRLSQAQLSKVLIDLMTFLELKDNAEIEHENTPVDILNILKAIKYIPEYNVAPEEFRNGLFMSSTKIIYPIITFLLENKEIVKRRYYLSKFVMKIEVPKDRLSDKYLFNLNKEYNKLIEKFWLSYSENKKEQNNSKEANELSEDLWQMKLELNNLKRHLQLQEEKLASNNITSSFIRSVEGYLKEQLRTKKLQNQYLLETEQLEKYSDYIQSTSERIKVYSLVDLINSGKCNKDSLKNNETVFNNIKIYLEILESIDNDNEPTQYVINELENDLKIIQKEVHELSLEKKRVLYQNRTNNVEKLSTEKESLQTDIQNLQVKSDQTILKIIEVKDILSGYVLHGKQLKNYVHQLRTTSNEYKTLKQDLNIIEKEFKILNRTLEILNEEKENPDALKECKLWNYDKLLQKYKLMKNDLIPLELTYKTTKKYFDELQDDYFKRKSSFNNLSNNLADLNDGIIEDNNIYENQLRHEECLIKSITNENESLSESLLRITQEIIESSDDSSFIDSLKNKLITSQKINQDLKEKVSLKEEEDHMKMEELHQINNITEMVYLKTYFNK